MEKLKERYIKADVIADLKEKMVFIGGPRQVGKTYFSLSFLAPSLKTNLAYLNWDEQKDRKMILQQTFPMQEKLIIFDELHKFTKWRGLIKGLYDKYSPQPNFLITGSARLDYYRKGGDSLQGRYHYYRLHPFSLRELNKDPTSNNLEQLLKFGGFPEPLLKANVRFWRRWNRERISRVINTDLRDLENVKEPSLIELLVEALPERVGSPLSVKSLSEDLQVSHETTERWLKILENLYLVFRIPPFGSPKIRAVKKEQKLYLWDWSQVPSEGAKFENLVASQLLKYCHYQEDTQGYKMELRFIRDTDKREVDFVVLQDKKPLFAVECKTGEKKISSHCRYFKERAKIPEFFQVHLGKADYGSETKDVRVLPFLEFCKIKKLP